MKTLYNLLLFGLYYFVSWVGYFFLSRVFFLIYYNEQSSALDLKTLLQIPLYGLKLDLASSAYMVVIPFLILCTSIFIPKKAIITILKTYTFSILFLVNLLMFFDLAIYDHWQIRLDATPLIYINTPSKILASVTTLRLISFLSLWIASSLFYVFVYKKIIDKSLKNFQKCKILEIPVLILLICLLVIVMRGGLQNTPINQSSVYFSDKMFANNSSVNFAWNFINSVISGTHDTKNHFELINPSEAKKNHKNAILKLRKAKIDLDCHNILKSKKTNVILIIWESLTSKVVEPLGGLPHVTENFNLLTKEGILFTNFYANGERSDKGLVAIMSGYYPQPHKSIIKMTSKAKKLPMLPQKMKLLGYTTSFYHGGDIDFCNMKAYFRAGSVNNFVSENDFNSANANSKWGIHDHIVLERFLNDIPKYPSKLFFKIVFTLSSHEPFEFPDKYKFGSDTPENKFKSSLAYTDKAIGKFIKNAKKQPWWNNTLIIITADHGHRLPKQKIFNSPKRFHIPMLWLGGALSNTNIKISNISSQKDIAHTLLYLLDGDYNSFEWGINILKKSSDHFAHYIFNKGFGTINKTGVFVYDYNSKKPLLEKGKSASDLEKLGKAITQTAYQNFLEIK